MPNQASPIISNSDSTQSAEDAYIAAIDALKKSSLGDLNAQLAARGIFQGGTSAAAAASMEADFGNRAGIARAQFKEGDLQRAMQQKQMELNAQTQQSQINAPIKQGLLEQYMQGASEWGSGKRFLRHNKWLRNLMNQYEVQY